MEAASSSIDARFSHQISALLNPPPLAQVQKYFEELLVQRQCHGLKIKLDGEYGKGVYSEVGFKEDDLILRDQMLVGSQHSSNKIDCFVCSFCFRFISSVELQIGRRLHLQELGVSAVDECKKSDELGCASSTSQERTSVPSDFVQSLLSGDLKLPHSDKFPLPSVVSCVGGCKEVFYCSEACAKNDWESFHSLLCTGKGSLSLNKEAVSKFTQHANETNDIFIPAAKVISSTILRYRKLKAAHAKSPGKYTPDQGDNCDFSLLLEAWKPVSVGYKRRWWDCIALPEDVDSCDEAAFRMQIKDLAHESLQLLKEALYDDECAPLFSLDIYGHIIGMFELNNLDLVVASPVEDYFLYIDDLQPLEKEKAEKVTKHLLDALGEDYSIPCQGTAFFPIQSCMNHSCIPNAKAFKRDEDRDGQATIIALRPIVEGEEITISYIDEDLAYEDRQEALADYGFRCKCPKCLKEGGA